MSDNTTDALVEQEETNDALEGQVESPQRLQRNFTSLKALTDYVHCFNITGGQFQTFTGNIDGVHTTHYILIYNNGGN